MNPSQPAQNTSVDPDADAALLAQARDHIAEEFGGAPPAIEIDIEDRRIRLRGKVADAATAERLAKAAAIGPGVLGVSNELEFEGREDGTDAAPGPHPGASAAPEAAREGVPLPPPEGMIHHKV